MKKQIMTVTISLLAVLGCVHAADIVETTSPSRATFYVAPDGSDRNL